MGRRSDRKSGKEVGPFCGARFVDSLARLSWNGMVTQQQDRTLIRARDFGVRLRTPVKRCPQTKKTMGLFEEVVRHGHIR